MQRIAWFGGGVELQRGVVQVVGSVFGVRTGRVVCAEVAELGGNASQAESSQNSWVHCSWRGARRRR